jgi:hypothetical protein
MVLYLAKLVNAPVIEMAPRHNSYIPYISTPLQICSTVDSEDFRPLVAVH